jgi:hypothetical protein
VALDDAARCAAAGDDVGAVAVWRLSASDGGGDDASHAAAPALRIAPPPGGEGVSCLQLSGGGDLLAWLTVSGVAGVARVPSPDAEHAASAAAALFDTGRLTASTLSFAAGGPLADALVLGTHRGLLLLPGALARGGGGGAEAAGAARVPLSGSPAVTCHQQGVGGAPAVIAAATRGGGVALHDTRLAARAAGELTLLPHDTGSTALCLHAHGTLLATGHEDGTATVFDLRAPLASLHSASPAAPGLPLAERPPALLRAHRHAERLWALHLDAQRLVTAGLDAVVAVHDW